MIMWVLVLSLPRKESLPSEGPSFWPNFPWSLCGTEETNATLVLASDRPPWLFASVSHTCLWGTGIVSTPENKKLLLASTDDCYSLARDYIDILGNFAKVTFHALSKTYNYLIWPLESDCIHQVLSGNHWPSVKTHTRVCSGEGSGYHIEGCIQ